MDPNGHLGYFHCDKNNNNPIYLSRPRQNNFNVRIIDNNLPPGYWVDDATLPSLPMSSYVLILSFEECD